jgi:WD40 repeat protein
MLVLNGHTPRQTVHSVAFAPDGNSLLSTSLDATVRLWDWRAGTNRVVGRLFTGHGSRRVAFAPDGRTVAWSDYAPSERVWNHWQIVLHESASGTTVSYSIIGEEAYPEDFHFCYSPDGRLLAAAEWNVYLWETQTGESLSSWGDSTVTGSLAFAPDGQTLAVGHTHRNARTGRLRHEVVLYHPRSRNVHGILLAPRRVRNLTFSPNGRLLAAACENTLTVWETPAEEGDSGTIRVVPQAIFTCKSGRRHFQGLAFTPDGHHLAATHNDKTVRIWDTRSWTERVAFDWGIGEVVCIAFSPDGMVAAAGGRSGRIVVWDVDL